MTRYIDQHVHSKVSHDGISTIKEHILEAKEKNIKEITFTEHYDDYTGIQTNLTTLDVDKYRQIYLENKDDQIIKTNFGIEIGLRPESYQLISNMVAKNKFDFIIGSSHITCGKDIAYDKSFFEGISKEKAILKYFQEVLQNIKMYTNEFDVYGHLDYIIRYINKNYKDKMFRITYGDFKEILDEILITLIQNNKGLEINTSGLRYGLNNAHPNIEILREYKMLGGKIITMGSDAHKKEDLASDFDIAYQILEQAGFDKIAVYHNRTPEFRKIKTLK